MKATTIQNNSSKTVHISHIPAFPRRSQRCYWPVGLLCLSGYTNKSLNHYSVRLDSCQFTTIGHKLQAISFDCLQIGRPVCHWYSAWNLLRATFEFWLYNSQKRSWRSVRFALHEDEHINTQTHNITKWITSNKENEWMITWKIGCETSRFNTPRATNTPALTSYTYICMCVCVFVCFREKERERVQRKQTKLWQHECMWMCFVHTKVNS